MDYIYNGEVNIFQDCLDRFLSVAQRLKLEGLMGNEDNEQEVHDDFTKDEAHTKGENVHTAKYNTHNSHLAGGGDVVAKVDKILVPISSADVSEFKERVQQYIERDADGKVKCTICGKEGIGKNPGTARCVLEKHIETHLEGLSYPCQLCGKTFRSRNSYKTHKCFRKCF